MNGALVREFDIESEHDLRVVIGHGLINDDPAFAFEECGFVSSQFDIVRVELTRAFQQIYRMERVNRLLIRLLPNC